MGSAEIVGHDNDTQGIEPNVSLCRKNNLHTRNRICPITLDIRVSYISQTVVYLNMHLLRMFAQGELRVCTP